MPERPRVERLEVSVGGLSRRQLIDSLSSRGILVNGHAETLIENVIFDDQRSRPVVVTERTVAELGLPSGATLTQIFDVAQQQGLTLCPVDTAPYLRMALNEQVASRDSVLSSGSAPDGGLTVAAEALSKDVEYPKGFYLRVVDGQTWLRGYRCDDEHTWSPDDRFIFQLPPAARFNSAGCCMTEHLPSWPTTPPTYGSVVLREFRDDDVHLAFDFGDDPYIPLIGSLPALPTAQQALEWIYRQRGRLAEGKGLSFAIADAESDNAVGAIGLWLQNMSAGRATIGYSVAPAHRGRGIASSALKALTAFAWTIPALHRIELYIEPWNSNSSRVAEATGFQREGLLRSHQEIGGTRRDMLLYAITRP